MYNNEPIFLKPIFREKIWGRQKLLKEFNYNIPFKQTGEAWVISANSKGTCMIANGYLSGNILAFAWKEYGELFNNKNAKKDYPLLVKILDAHDNLSVQVHPNDVFAREIHRFHMGRQSVGMC